jgi:uncharacterized beta-barrel protein YwiB (DUF1934 family)
MPNLLRGVQTHSLSSAQRVRDVAKEIYEIHEGEAELLQLMMSRKGMVKPVNSRKFEYNEKRLAARVVTITGISGTTITVSDADCELVRKGTVLRKSRTVATRITATPNYAANTFTVASAAGLEVGDVLRISGMAGAEADDLPAPFHTEPDLVVNYLQEVNHAYQVTRWSRTEARYDGPIVATNRRDILLYHKIDCNDVLWFGKQESAGTDSAGRPVLGTKGILETITSNIGSFDNGEVTFKTLREAVGDYTLKSKSKELDLYVAPDVWSVLDDLFWQKMQITAPIIDRAGVAMRQITLGPKTLNLIQVVGFADCFANNIMVGIDPAYFEIKTGKDQETGRVQWMLEIEQAAEDLNSQAEKVTYVTDIAACLKAEEAHFIMENAITAKA